tara:strand:+ start:13558 stop:14232 length:675 start_codon:yes stop_codon:yes gene_type:complete
MMSETIREGGSYDMNIYPTPIRLINLPNEYAQICNFFDEQEHNPDSNGNTKQYGSHSKNTYILDEPECKEFKKYILKKVKEYNDKVLGYDVDEWIFSQTWVSHKEPGQSHIAHTHPNSIISGVFFYGGVADDTSAIEFHKPQAFSSFNTFSIEKKFNEKNPNTWNSFAISFDVGKFILFPSYLQHSVPMNTTNIVRKSISMNIVPKGGVGDKGSLTELLFNRVV